jgi:hypothetical protein
MQQRQIFDHIHEGMKRIGVRKYGDVAMMTAEVKMTIGGSDMLAFEILEWLMDDGGIETFGALQEVIAKAQFLIMQAAFTPEIKDETTGREFRIARDVIVRLTTRELDSGRIYHVLSDAMWWVSMVANVKEFVAVIAGEPMTPEEAEKEFGLTMDDILREARAGAENPGADPEKFGGLISLLDYLREHSTFVEDGGRGIMRDADGTVMSSQAHYGVMHDRTDETDPDGFRKWEGRIPTEVTDILGDSLSADAFAEFLASDTMQNAMRTFDGLIDEKAVEMFRAEMMGIKNEADDEEE